MSKLKTYELLWDTSDHPVNPDLLIAFRKLGSDVPLNVIEIRAGNEEAYRKRREELERPRGAVREWLRSNGMNPVYNGPHDRWMCLLTEDEAFEFRVRWL